jgi:hypothetical protein
MAVVVVAAALLPWPRKQSPNKQPGYGWLDTLDCRLEVWLPLLENSNADIQVILCCFDAFASVNHQSFVNLQKVLCEKCEWLTAGTTWASFHALLLPSAESQATTQQTAVK